MDKTSNVGRIEQNTIKPSSAARLDKYKRYHKVRKLSAVVKATNGDMGCDLSERTREPLSIRDRLNLSKRLFGDCNGVDHASVPRKIRTAMKRRNRESTSSADAKKLSLASCGFSLSNSKKSRHKIYGVQPSKKNGSKKSRPNKKQGKSDGSQRRFVSGLVTKDEEEVAETLSAWADMFPDSDCTRKNTLEVSETNSSTCLETGKISLPALEASSRDSADAKVDLSSNASDIAKYPPNFGQTPAESFGDKTLKEQAELPIRKETRNELDSSVPQVNLQTISADVPLNLCLVPGIMQPIQQDTSLAQKKPEFTLGQVNANQSQLEQHYIGTKCKINGLYSTVSNVVGDGDPALWQTSTKFPAPQDAALCNASQALLKDGSSTEMIYIAANRKPWRRCETHVYISWLIKTLQMTEMKDNLQLQSCKLRSDRGSNQYYFVGSPFKGLTNCFSTLVPTKSDTTCASGGIHMKFTEDGSDGLHPRRLQSHKQPASDLGFSTLQKEGFHVLPFSSGNGELGTSSCSSMPGKRHETSSYLQVPYFDSYMQHQVLMHASVPKNRYSSVACPDNLSFPPVTQQQAYLQQHPYVGSPLRTSPIASLTKRHQQQLQHHKQQLHHQQLCWNYGGQDSSMLLSSSNSVLPPALKSGRLPISKFDMVFQQQQKFMPLVSSLPPGMIKRPDGNPPLYEENGVELRSNNNALLLQLL